MALGNFESTLHSVWQAATVPGDVMTDLMDNGQMNSPYSMTNERLSQWVEKASWVYRHRIHASSPIGALLRNRSNWCLKASTRILPLFSMEIRWEPQTTRIEPTDFHVSHLNEGLNTLEVLLHAAVDKGQIKLDASPWPVPVSNEARPQGQQTSSVSRKALYHYGWDWGPRLVSAGIWKSVTLERGHSAHPSSIRMDLVKLHESQATYRLERRRKTS